MVVEEKIRMDNPVEYELTAKIGTLHAWDVPQWFWISYAAVSSKGVCGQIASTGSMRVTEHGEIRGVLILSVSLFSFKDIRCRHHRFRDCDLDMYTFCTFLYTLFCHQTKSTELLIPFLEKVFFLIPCILPFSKAPNSQLNISLRVLNVYCQHKITSCKWGKHIREKCFQTKFSPKEQHVLLCFCFT